MSALGRTRRGERGRPEDGRSGRIKWGETGRTKKETASEKEGGPQRFGEGMRNGPG